MVKQAYTLMILPIMLVLVSCEESELDQEGVSNDYRTQWVGDYHTMGSCHGWGATPGNSALDDTVSVAILTGTSDSLLIGGIMEIPIDSSGYFYTFQSGSNWYQLNLWDDSLRIAWAYGGLGGGMHCAKIGAKIE